MYFLKEWILASLRKRDSGRVLVFADRRLELNAVPYWTYSLGQVTEVTRSSVLSCIKRECRRELIFKGPHSTNIHWFSAFEL